MATKDKKPAKSSGTRVTRVTASTEKAEKKPASTPKTKTAPAKKTSTAKARSAKKLAKPLTATGGYFKGAWYELKQVRWPTRRATWGMTGALVLFTAFFVVLILLLDALFKYLFELMLG